MTRRENKISRGTEYCIEHDSIGEKQIPKDAYYGMQTLRAVEDFFIAGLKVHPEFINNSAQVKEAAAITNSGVGRPNKKRAGTVVQVCNEAVSGKLHGELIVDSIQGGTGTSLNMNANKVTTDRAIEILGGEKGGYSAVNPNDHISYGQSTNNVFPLCGKLTILKLLYKTQTELGRLYHALMEKSKEFNHAIKMEQTQLQDAVPIRLEQGFHAYTTAIRRSTSRFDRIEEGMRHLNLGGTAVETRLNTNARYSQQVVKSISLISDLELIQACDLTDAIQNLDGYVACSGIAKSCTMNLSKICNDSRLMSSGPRTGLGEINLSAKQNDSFIIPGKVSPVIPGMANQVAFHVTGNNITVIMAAETRQLELNTLEPIVLYRLFRSVETIACAMHTLTDNYISGITTNGQHYKNITENSVGVITAICPYVGYKEAVNVAKGAIWIDRSVRELVIGDKFLVKEQLDITLNPVPMTEPGISGIGTISKTEGF